MPTYNDESTDRVRVRPLRTIRLEPETVVKEKTAITGLDDMDVRSSGDNLMSSRELAMQSTSKVHAARVFSESMQKDLRELCRGLENEMAAIGFQVANSSQFQGSEKVYHFLGDFLGINSATTKALSLRLQRLEKQDLKESVKQISAHVQQTILELAQIEDQYKVDVKEYGGSLKNALAKLKEAQPKFAIAKTNRESIEGELSTLKLELDSGTVTEEDRPAKEALYEDLQKKLNAAKLLEIDLLSVIKNAQEHIPILQQSRNAADQSIQSIHQMRRNLLEKMENLKVVLERSTTALKAQARLELFSNVDPVMNKTVTLVTQNNIKVASAAMEVAAERSAKATMDPVEYKKAEGELMDAVAKYVNSVADLEEMTQKGSRVPSGNSGNPGDEDEGDRS